MGIIFGLGMGLFYSFFYDLKTGIRGGIFCGVSFGFITALIALYNSSKVQKERPQFIDEKLEKLAKEEAASHFMGAEVVGGWIYLTDKRLFFKSHPLSIQNHELSILLSDIENTEKSRSLLGFRNRLYLKLKNGKVEKFVVNEPGDWIRILQNRMIKK